MAEQIEEVTANGCADCWQNTSGACELGGDTTDPPICWKVCALRIELRERAKLKVKPLIEEAARARAKNQLAA